MSHALRLVVLTVLVGLFTAQAAWAQEEIHLRPIKDVSINDVLADTQYSTDETDRMTLMWWLPDEFWAVSLASDPTTTEEGIKEVTDLVSQYTMVICVDGQMGPFGGVRFVPPSQVRQQIILINAEGEEVKPLDDNNVAPDMMMLVGSMRPVLQNMLGPMGQNMSFVIFPRKDSTGRVIADAVNKGEFTMKLNDLSFEVQTPLPSLLVPKHCSKCGRDFRGDYNYCPYDRTELTHAE